MSARPVIRPAQASDAIGVAAIWNPLIRDSAVTFTTVEKTETDIVALMAEPQSSSQHFFAVAAIEGQLAGFALFAPFRSGPGYRHTVEHSIHVASDWRGRGVGRALMDVLLTAATARDVHSLIAGISAENTAAIAFHTAMGFCEVGRLPEVGRKFDRWLDLVLMCKTVTSFDPDTASKTR